jgi:hypothetical protein
MVLHQLRCCGVLEVARIARAGFPTRYTHQVGCREPEVDMKLGCCRLWLAAWPYLGKVGHSGVRSCGLRRRALMVPS